MKLQVLDAVASMEQTKTLYNRSKDPQYKDLINSRPLDPRLNSLKQVKYVALFVFRSIDAVCCCKELDLILTPWLL